MASVVPEHGLKQLDYNRFQVSYTTSDSKPRHVVIADQDFHAMGKKHLGDIIAGTS
jgi:hypothetical protein